MLCHPSPSTAVCHGDYVMLVMPCPQVRWPLDSFGRGANRNPGLPGGKRLGGYDDPHAKVRGRKGARGGATGKGMGRGKGRL